MGAAHKFGRLFTGQVTAAGKFPPTVVLTGAVSPRSAPRAASGAIVRTTDPE